MEAARSKLLDLEPESKPSIPAGPSKPTVSEVALMQLNSITRYGVDGRTPQAARPATRLVYEKSIRRMAKFEPRIADLPLASLTRAQADAHLSEFRKTVAAQTADHYQGLLHTIGNWAVDQELISTNPFRKVGRHGRGSKTLDRVALELDEINRLNIATQSSPTMRAALRLLRSGLRASEVIALSEDDIDARLNTIRIKYSQVQAVPGWAKFTTSPFFLDEPKTPTSTTTLTLHGEVIAELLEALKYAKVCEVECYDKPGLLQKKKFVVHNRHFKGLLYNNFQRQIKHLFEVAKVDLPAMYAGAVRWNHVWRNTLAADLLALGADDLIIRNLMRHRDANTSKTVYASARNNHLHVYRSYASKVKKASDYLQVIAKIDLDMEAGESRFLLKQVSIYDLDDQT
jgi:integrase